MNWNANKSVRLSQVCVVIFAALLLALDIGCYWAVTWFVRLRRMQPPMVLWMMLTIYLCSIFAWLLLAQLWRLLRNIQAGRVFEEENVHILRAVSWCCAGAGLALRGGRGRGVLYGADRAHRQERFPAGARHEIRAGSHGLGGAGWKFS